MIHTNSIEPVWPVKHCQQYVNEFTFWLNDVGLPTMTRINRLLKTSKGERLTGDLSLDSDR